jgi:cyclase
MCFQPVHIVVYSRSQISKSSQKESSVRIPFSLFSALICCLAATSAAAQRDFSNIQIETVSVAEGIHMLKGAGGNIAVSSGEDGIFLIDDQFAPLTEKILAAVAKIKKGPVRFVLNTHWHGDHTGGNENLGKAGAVIVAHENVRKLMIAASDPPAPQAALPVITFTEGVTFHLNGQDIVAFWAAAAHTSGDSIIHFRNSNVIHAGDTYFAGMYPFIDRRSGGSLSGTIAAADRILELADEDTKIIPGHGPLSNKSELKAYREMLITVQTRVRAAIAKGQSADEMIAGRLLNDLDETWATGFIKSERWLRMIYGIEKK